MLVIPLRPGAENAHPRFSVQLGENLIDFELDFISYLDAPAWSMNLVRDGSRIVSGAMLEPLFMLYSRMSANEIASPGEMSILN